MKFFRISNFLPVMVATALGVLLFWTSQSVQQNEEKLSKVQASLEQEKDTIRVLSVEWEYLNAPQRLEKLASEELGMHASEVPDVVRHVSDIPEPSPVIVANADYEESFAQSVSYDPSFRPKITVPVKASASRVVASRDDVVSPQAAEKHNFDSLIQTLSESGQ